MEKGHPESVWMTRLSPGIGGSSGMGSGRCGSGEGEGWSHLRGMCSPRCPHPACPEPAAAAELAPGCGCCPSKAGQALPPSRPARTLSLQRSPVPPGSSSRTMDGRGGWHPGDAVGMSQGTTRHHKAPQGTSPWPRKELRNPWGHVRVDRDCPQHWERDREPRAASANGRRRWRRRRMGHPRGAPGALQCPWEKDRAPQGCSFRAGSTPGPHPEPVIATGRRMEHPGRASPVLREGWGMLRMQLQRWEQDRAPRGCTQSPSCH